LTERKVSLCKFCHVQLLHVADDF